MKTLMPDSGSDFDAIEFAQDPPVPRRLWIGMGLALGCLLLPLLTAAVAMVVGDGVRLMSGTKPLAYAVDPLIYGLFYALMLQFVLTIPVGSFAYPQVKRFRFVAARWAVLFALLAAPLLSFAYYKAGKIADGQLAELVLAIVPAAFLAAVYFERLERSWLITAWLFVGTFLPLFLVNDLMGPFSTYYSYASRFEYFYWLRIAAPALAIVGSGFFLLGQRSESRE